jgi:alkanesulfonate monooxygenase SsuD/methylene tetrahydromethanopterin reductase-like flavin-dependent oxidoreductase (luciferase family)
MGYDSVWVGDHVLWPVFWPDAMTLLAGAATATDRVALGTGVLLAALRRPAPLAKQTASLQWLSSGRFRLGVGVGGEFEPEFAASGVALERRGAALDDTLEALQALWSGERVTLFNETVQLDGALLDVVPKPRIPIWVGGRSAPAQRRAARFGDAWMPFVITPQRFAEGWANVRSRAEALDRDASTIVPALQLWCMYDDDLTVALPTIAERIESTYRTPFDRFEQYAVYGDAAMWLDRLGAYLDAGVRHVNLVFAGGDRLAQLTRIATEVVPQLEARLASGRAS